MGRTGEPGQGAGTFTSNDATNERREMIHGHRILITGGAGFIGTAILKRLLPRNKVVVYDNLRRDALQFFPHRNHRNLEMIQGDILDREELRRAVDGVDTVIHLAAIAGVSSYYRMPRRTMEVNLIGTYNVLESVREMKIYRFLDFSTSEIYGPHIFRAAEDGGTHQGNIKDPRWTYAISKLAAERFSWCYQHELGLPVVSVRPFNIFGPGQVGEGAIQIFIRQALTNKPITITGDGVQIRAWCYITDMVDAVLRALERPEAVGETFNIGNPENTVTMVGLAKTIRRLTKSKSRLRFSPHQGVDVDLRVPSIKKAQRLLNFKPKVDMEDGLVKTIKWYKEHSF